MIYSLAFTSRQLACLTLNTVHSLLLCGRSIPKPCALHPQQSHGSIQRNLYLPLAYGLSGGYGRTLIATVRRIRSMTTIFESEAGSRFSRMSLSKSRGPRTITLSWVLGSTWQRGFGVFSSRARTLPRPPGLRV